MKLLLVTLSDNADHQEVILSLFEELAADYDVWAMVIKNPKVPHIESKKIIYVDAPSRPGITKGTFNLNEIQRIPNFVKKQKFDVIYFETLHTWNIPIWKFHPKKTKIIQAMHDVEPHAGDSAVKSVELMNSVAVKSVDTILLRNKMFIPLLENKYGISPDKVKALDPWRRFPDYDPPMHSHRALFFGRLNEYKGVEYLPAIVNLCPNVNFDVVGRVDASVQEKVDELKRFDNVKLVTEYVSDADMKRYFHEADFVVLPYKSASQSGVVLDADKFGRPPIAFSVGAIKNQIEQWKNGVLVSEGDVNSFAEQVRKLSTMSDADLDHFSKTAYEYSFERFSSKSCSKKFMNIVREVLK